MPLIEPESDVPVILRLKDGMWDKVLHTGSRVIGGSTDTSDDDWLVYCDSGERASALCQVLMHPHDFEYGGSLQGTEMSFRTEHSVVDGKLDRTNTYLSLKRGSLNIIVTANREYFDDFTRATVLGKALNLTDKGRKIVLFEALCWDVWPTSEKKIPF